jgi:mevalonate kinase
VISDKLQVKSEKCIVHFSLFVFLAITSPHFSLFTYSLSLSTYHLIMTFHANGKLLLTGEYFVLDGATALALPTKLGQSLTVEQAPDMYGKNLYWYSQTPDLPNWFWGELWLDKLFIRYYAGDKTVCEGLETIFKAIDTLNPLFWSKNNALVATSTLEFPRNWGLGSSATLVSLLAKWANIDPFTLNDATFGGSGYDIACAEASKPIFFERKNGQYIVKEVDFKPIFVDNLYFVFLNQKQNSREGIARYREKSGSIPPQYFDDISALTQVFYAASNLSDFEKLIDEHENLVASVIELPRAKSLYFNDFWGEIKSLGAWGGDFVLATSERPFEETKSYFEERGFTTILKYNDLIL